MGVLTLREMGTKGKMAHTFAEPAVQCVMMFLTGGSGGLVLLIKYWRALFTSESEGGLGMGFGLLVVGGVLGAFFFLLRTRARGGVLPADLKANTDLRGKTCIVTGANSGIGLYTTFQLVEWGAHVIMACRNEAYAKTAIEQIKDRQATTTAPYGKNGSVEYVNLDLASFESIRNFAKAVENKPIHQLICNAGILGTGEFKTSSTGHEAQVGVNHFGHFLLVKCLMENLTTNNAKVIVVSSVAHIWLAPAGPLDVSTLTPEYSKAYYDGHKYYGISKLCNLLFAIELQNKFAEAGSKATAYSLHPGCIPTNLPNSRMAEGDTGKGASVVKKAMAAMAWTVYQAVKPVLFKSLESGAATTCYLAAQSNDKLVPGAYYQDSAPFPAGPGTEDVAARKALWDYSEQVCSQN